MTRTGRRDWRRFWVLYAALAVFFAVQAGTQAARYRLSAAAAAGVLLCLLSLLALALIPGFRAPRQWARERLSGHALLLFLVPYLLYAAGTGDLRWLSAAKVVALAALPLLIYRLAPAAGRSLRAPDAAVLAWLAVPVLLRWIRGIWTVPVNLDFMTRLFLLGVGSWSFLVCRGLEDSGYEFRISLRGLRDALVNFAAFSFLAAPLGFLLGFISWTPRWGGAGQFGFDLLTIFLFIALPEELFFRGALQNLLEGSWGSRSGAQAAASVVFGFTHILHAPVPNWRYVILAAIAGWFYGTAYRGTRSLMASAMTHALVDAAWKTWFQLPRR